MKIEKCPFCDKDVAETSNCRELLESCPAAEPYVCVVCNMHEGGCGASSGYYDSAEKAIAAWNRRAGKDINVTTNADRMRSMSDEELARFLGDEPPYLSTYDKYLDWLRQPAKEEHNETDRR